MTTGIVQNTIRRANRNVLIWSILGAILIAAILLLNWRYFYNFLLGPRQIDRQELFSLRDPNAPLHYWVTVEGDDVEDTGVQMVSRNRRSGSERVTSNYMALQLDDRWLLVKAAGDAPATSYSGALVTRPTDVMDEVVNGTSDPDEVREIFLPAMLDAGSFRTGGIIGLVVSLPLLLLCLWSIFNAVQRTSDPLKHPIMKRLGRLGQPQQVASEIENELLAPQQSIGTTRLTRNWLVSSVGANLDAMRLNEVVWAYKHVTQRRVNGVPTGKTFAAHLHDRHGQLIAIVCKNEDEANAVLASVMQAAPWALAGYNAELDKAWKKERASVLAAVDQRRQQVLNPQA